MNLTRDEAKFLTEVSDAVASINFMRGHQTQVKARVTLPNPDRAVLIHGYGTITEETEK